MPDAEDLDIAVYDGSGATVRVEHPDGSITVSTDGKPLIAAPSAAPGGWWDDVSGKLGDAELFRISDLLKRGVEDDDRSRAEWLENRKEGLKLLGLKLEGAPGAPADGAPVEGTSRVRHPLLLEAVLRFQAGARSELLPTDGPVKARDRTGASPDLAEALERDLNWFLTTVATEYYPDTDRMLFMLGLGGSAFRKVYFCPVRQRPVIESIDAENLIVDDGATDLRNARRITHRTHMGRNDIRRMQVAGVFRDVELGDPSPRSETPPEAEKRGIEGRAPGGFAPDDAKYEIWEIWCDLDVAGFEHKVPGKSAPSGLDAPWRVTMERSTGTILSIVRNYPPDGGPLPEARVRFVKYSFVPGVGFYDIGLLHMLGNTTRALTAGWREMLDAGMYATFPGFLFSDAGGANRQDTNTFRVPPGGGAQVKTGSMPIRDAIMPLPYQGPSAPLMQLIGDLAETGQRVGGTSELQVGEGRAEMPVGTMLAMVEQATKVMNAVHKRLHAAQAEELRLLAEVFREHPESFWEIGRAHV